MFGRILIANRGEIALRIIRAARELEVDTVCVYSEAIHPGYGFLAENAHFAEICRDCQIEFIGPSPEAMQRLGDKINCKRLAKEAGTPVFPGTDGEIEEQDEAIEIASEIGYPVIVKASAGGGGKGMRVAHNIASLRTAVTAAQQEAIASFGNGAVYLEKFLDNARHVEVQVIGDKHGNAVHLYNRDCTSQRRHQKLIEEGPAPGVTPEVRDRVCESAAQLIKNAEYSGAATVEFLMNEKEEFFMLEVNTRVQVEHPVTEMITGVDIVKESIRVAAGNPLSWTQDEIQINGHAIECRINAEDPSKNFMPQPGTIDIWRLPGGPGVRVETHVREGYRIPPNYDSMIGKLIVHGRDRNEAIARTRAALSEMRVSPIATTIPLLQQLLNHHSFVSAEFDINWVERLLEQ